MVSGYIDEKTIYELLKPYAYKALKDLSNESHKVIDNFYSDYIPEYYKRTYGMKNLFKPIMKKIQNGYRVEFTYSADYLTTEHDSNIDVFNGSFVEGWHGGKYAWGYLKMFTPQTTPSPWNSLVDYVNTYKV